MIYFIYIIYIHLFHGNIWTHNWPAPNVSGFTAQLVRALHRYREVAGSNPVEVLIFFFFFSGFLTQLQFAFITARIILHLFSIPQFIYDLFYIHHLHSWVYCNESNLVQNSRWRTAIKNLSKVIRISTHAQRWHCFFKDPLSCLESMASTQQTIFVFSVLDWIYHEVEALAGKYIYIWKDSPARASTSCYNRSSPIPRIRILSFSHSINYEETGTSEGLWDRLVRQKMANMSFFDFFKAHSVVLVKSAS